MATTLYLIAFTHNLKLDLKPYKKLFKVNCWPEFNR